jgi:hypothetical protein
MKIQETQSVKIPLNGMVNNLEIIVNSFSLFQTSIEVIWKLTGTFTIKEGTLTIPNNIVSSWGTDDTIIKDYVLEQLGLVEDLTPEPVIEKPITPIIDEEPII